MKRIIFSLVICLMLLTAVLPVYADTTYIVKPGDSLSKIAAQFGVSVQAIVTANGLTDPNVIRVGQNLIIPAPGTEPSAPAAANTPAGSSTLQKTYRVQSSDTLYKISRLQGVSLAALMTANGLTTYTIFVGQVLNIPAAGSTAPVAATPAPAASGYRSRGLKTDYFYVEANQIGVGQPLWFDFKITNVGGGTENFGVLSIFSNINLHGQSWTNSSIKWPDSLEWRDHITVGTAGTYGFYLAICYGDTYECNNNPAAWERLSDTAWVNVGNLPDSTGYTSSRGVVGNYFYVENIVSRKGDPVWFDFKVTNTGGDDAYYGILSAQVKGIQLGKSWTSTRLKAGESLEWRDHFYDLPAGTFSVFLGICHYGKDYCAGDGSLWERLSNEIIITVKDPDQ